MNEMMQKPKPRDRPMHMKNLEIWQIKNLQLAET
jgi:hypothetical protein